MHTTQTLYNPHVQDAADSLKNCPTGQMQVLSPFSPTTHCPPGHCIEHVFTAEGNGHG